MILLRALLGGPASGKGLLVLPFVSLAREKAAALEPLAAAAGVELECFHGAHGRLPLPRRRRQLCVATIEKAERILGAMLAEGRAAELRVVVVDEARRARAQAQKRARANT